MAPSARPASDPPSARWREAHSSLFGPSSDSILDSRLIAQTLEKGENLSRWMGWRLKLLVLAALMGCIAMLLVTRWLGNSPHLPAEWQAGAAGQLELAASPSPPLKPLVGRALISIGSTAGSDKVEVLDGQALQRSARWVTIDAERDRLQEAQERLSRVMSQERVRLEFDRGAVVEVSPRPRGLSDLGPTFWLLAGLALTLYLIAMVVLLARPSERTLLYAVMSLSQSGNLVLMALESTLVVGLPGPFTGLVTPMRVAFDLITAAAIAHVATIHPRRVPAGPFIAWAGWTAMATLGGMMAAGLLDHLWWWTQAGVTVMGLVIIGTLSWSYRLLQHPFAVVMQRFGMVAVGTWVLLTAAVALADMEHIPSIQQQIAATGPMVWYVFLALLLLLSPFLSKSQQVMREFSLLAATSTVATSLDLLFVAVFSFGQFASVTLALFLSLSVYASARQWALNRVRSRNMLTTERMFEKLYRVAREVEAHPERTPDLVSQLLRELFTPMEVMLVRKRSSRVRVVGDGSTLLVPVPEMTSEQAMEPKSIVLRFANRGQSLFNSEDARLADRIVEQLRRAVAFDKAVERGRHEERLRLAQDLHDDIGARLLTLMYKAQSPEMEDYVRHTLQDLKTLTRGLAAPNRPLSHAAGEWKADLAHRLQAANATLDWNLSFDRDISLSVVQWSGLTRVMRELISNVIAHSQAKRARIDFQLRDDRLELRVTDNGVGRNPREWAHGLGLGGVRKRVKQLGGEVQWREASPSGICCNVTINRLSDRD
jgi:signal transduction histidine kinase